MELEHTNSSKVIKQFKNNLTTTLKNIYENCYTILDNHTAGDILKDVNKLQLDILDIIDWYANATSKQVILDYLRDYTLIDGRFNIILETLPSTFDYYLCLTESRFKLTYKEINFKL